MIQLHFLKPIDGKTSRVVVNYSKSCIHLNRAVDGPGWPASVYRRWIPVHPGNAGLLYEVGTADRYQKQEGRYRGFCLLAVLRGKLGLPRDPSFRSEEHTSELQSLTNLV